MKHHPFLFNVASLAALPKGTFEAPVVSMVPPTETVWTPVFDPPLPPDVLAEIRVRSCPTGGFWSYDGTAARGWGIGPLDAVLRLVANGRYPECVAVIAPDGTRFAVPGVTQVSVGFNSPPGRPMNNVELVWAPVFDPTPAEVSALLARPRDRGGSWSFDEAEVRGGGHGPNRGGPL